jgi:hypothetical protein
LVDVQAQSRRKSEPLLARNVGSTVQSSQTNLTQFRIQKTQGDSSLDRKQILQRSKIDTERLDGGNHPWQLQ